MNTLELPCACGEKKCNHQMKVEVDQEKVNNILISITGNGVELGAYVSFTPLQIEELCNFLLKKKGKVKKMENTKVEEIEKTEVEELFLEGESESQEKEVKVESKVDLKGLPKASKRGRKKKSEVSEEDTNSALLALLEE